MIHSFIPVFAVSKGSATSFWNQIFFFFLQILTAGGGGMVKIIGQGDLKNHNIAEAKLRGIA